ncbi:MAG: YtxH domain-containing protein [Anaerolineae bacterium]
MADDTRTGSSDQASDEAASGGREAEGFFALGALLGAAIGAAIGLLYAPRPGADTRSRLSSKTGETKEKLQDLGERTEDARSALEERAEAAMEKVRSGSDTVRGLTHRDEDGGGDAAEAGGDGDAPEGGNEDPVGGQSYGAGS